MAMYFFVFTYDEIYGLYHAALSCRVTNPAAALLASQQQQQHYKQLYKPLVMRMRLDLLRMIENLRENLLEELSAGFL